MIEGVAAHCDQERTIMTLPAGAPVHEVVAMGSSGVLTVVAVLCAAVLHAGWNAIAKADDNRLGMFARSSVVGVAVAAVGLCIVAGPARESWYWLAASVLVHVAYNGGLLYAYRVGDFNLTYPLARGVGPLVVAGVAATALREPLAPLPSLGVVVIAVSIGVLGLTPWRKVRANRAAVVAAVFTGLTIATYTLIDGVGVRRSGSPAGYTLWLVGAQSILTVAALLAFRRVRPGQALTTRAASVWAAAFATAVMSALAYGLVLWAQTRGALAAVAALRESSVVVAAIIGVLLFKEPMGRIRILASVAVAVGVVLLAIPGF